jgi:uncharacterized protein (TIGR03437 family)
MEVGVWPLSGKMLRLAALLLPVLLFGVTLGTDAQGARRDAATPDGAPTVTTNVLRGVPLAFEPNRGQAESEAKFVAHGAGYSILLNAREAVLRLGSSKDSWLRIRPLGANPSPLISALDELPGKSNYLDGAAPSTWHTNIPNYARVLYRDVYPGIDLAYHGNEGKLEYDWVVRPGADPALIRVSFPEARRIRLHAGELVIEVPAGEMRNRQPVAYQDIGGTRRYVAASYVLQGSRQVSFRLGFYDRRAPLVIDPTIVYLKPLPPTDGAPYLYGPVVDGGGNLNFLAGPYNVGDKPWAMKLSASGEIIFATQLGFLATSADLSMTVQGMAMDPAGSMYFTGYVRAGLAATAGALQPAPRGQEDGFVAKLNPTGSALVYSTFLGGNSRDLARAIAVDAAGSAYIVGRTDSADFPSTPGALAGCGNPPQLFVAKLNPLGTAISYSTCISGAYGPAGSGIYSLPGSIKVDTAGNAYVAGSTNSANYPTTPGALQTKFAGSVGCIDLSTPPGAPGFCEHGFVFKLNPVGSALVYSTFLQGSCVDQVAAMALDSSGNVYAAGPTCSADFPVTAGTLRAGGTFLAKLNPTGSGLVYSALAPGDGRVTGMSIDAGGNAYLAGTVPLWASTTFPLVNPIQAEFGAGMDLTYCSGFKGPGCYNAMIVKVNATGTALLYSTLFGSRAFGDGIAVDNSGNAYVNVSGLLLKLADAGSSPLFSSKAVTNAASFQPGIAAGGLATLFGTNLTNVQGVLTANSFPLPTVLGGTQVFVSTCTIPADAIYCLPAPVAAPILAVANVNGQQQINFQVPGAISEGVPVWVANNGVQSAPVQLHNGLPGIFTTDGVRGAILHAADFKPVTLSNPAVRAEPVVMYATGLGPVQPDPGAGNPASSSPLSLTSSTTIVTVGGKWALVLFSGLAPGFAGVSQINFLVPADAPSGDDDVIVAVTDLRIGTAISKPVKLAVR